MDEKITEHEDVNESKTGKFSDTEKKEINETLVKKHIDLHIGDTIPNEGLTLKTGEQILISIAEDIQIPKGYNATIEGVADMARLGIEVHAVQQKVSSENNEKTTLEVWNTGKNTITIYPGMKIAQIRFSKKTRK